MTDVLTNNIPLWIKLLYSMMVLIIIVIYWKEYGPINFLWLSDIALFLMVFALWFESRLITSMMALGVLPLELLWLVDFFFGGKLSGISSYMFDQEKPLYLRGLSLFHIVLILVIVYMLIKFGYDPRALPFQILLLWVLFPVTYFLAHRYSDENINWVYGLSKNPKKLTYPRRYLLLLMLGITFGLYLPLHFVLEKIFV